MAVNKRDIDQDTRISQGNRFYGPLMQFREWITAWRQERVTASVLATGRFSAPRTPIIRSLIKVNAATGDLETLVERPSLTGFDLSPSRSFVYFWYSASGEAEEPMVSTALMDLDTKSVIRLTPLVRASVAGVRWAPISDLLLIPSTPVGLQEDANHLIVFDPHKAGNSGSAREGILAELGGETDGEPVSVDFREAMWAGDNLIVYPKTSILDGQTSWAAIPLRESLPSPRQTFSAENGHPFAHSRGRLLFLVNGDVFAVHKDGGEENLTENLPPLSVRFAANSRTILGTQRTLPDLEQVLFSVDEEERSVYIDDTGDVRRSLHIPRDHAELHLASYTGVVFSRHARNRPSNLTVSAPERSSDIWTYNKHLEGLITTGPPIRVSYHGAKGRDLIGWLYLPAGATPEEKMEYPLVVIAYAGEVFDDVLSPTQTNDEPWAYRGVATTSMSLFTGAGYAVLLPSIPLNPRGKMRGDPMIEMMPSIHGALDAAISTGYIDMDRLALTGHSYGGYTALSVAVQTDKFDAIVASASLSNLASNFGEFSPYNRFVPAHGAKRASATGMIGGELAQSGLGAPPWLAEDAYIQNRPVFQAENVSTAILMFHGDMDWVPITQTEEMFTALARQDKDAIFVRYWGEPHGAKRPKNHEDMWERTLDFLKDNGVTPGPKKAH